MWTLHVLAIFIFGGMTMNCYLCNNIWFGKYFIFTCEHVYRYLSVQLQRASNMKKGQNRCHYPFMTMTASWVVMWEPCLLNWNQLKDNSNTKVQICVWFIDHYTQAVNCFHQLLQITTRWRGENISQTSRLHCKVGTLSSEDVICEQSRSVKYFGGFLRH